MKQILKHALQLLVVCFSTQLNAQLAKPVYRFVKNDPGEIQVHISLPDYKKTPVQINGETFYHVSMPDATHILEAGAPALVGYGGSLAIPENVIGRVEILSTKYTEEKDIRIAPSKGNLMRTVNPDEVPFTFGVWYNTNKFYPEKVAVLEEQYNLRKIHGQRFSLNALQYNPVTKTLRYYHEIILTVKLSGTQNQVLNFPLDKVENTSEFINIYRNQFLNFKNSGYERAVAANTISERGSMLILCHNQFMDAMKPFVDWKRKLGMNVFLTDVTSAGTTPDQIKAYIGNMYKTKKIAFVLLVGDAPQIPAMKLKSGPSDVGYTYQDGDDRYPDLIIGRFSAETVDHVKAQVSRSIDYERRFAATSSWRLNGICIASNEGPGDNNEMDWAHERKIRSMLLNYKYNSVSELYDGTHSGGVDKTGNPKDTDLAIEINKGAGIINYTGHGSSTSFGTTGFSNADIEALTNYDKLPFIFSVACVNGQFTKASGPCFAEVWLRSTKEGKNIGAVATIMSTINQSWDPPMYGQDQMDSILTESFRTNIKRSFGGVTFNALVKMNERYGNAGMQMTDTWTIFGDPSLVIMAGRGDQNILPAIPEETQELQLNANILTNPVSTSMYIKIGNTFGNDPVFVNIYTHSGLFVKSVKLNAGTSQAEISVNDLQNGLYYVQVQQNLQQVKLSLSVKH